MPRLLPKEPDWSATSTSDAIGRLFPHGKIADQSLSQSIPARYWPAGAIPPDSTKLDRRIQEFIESGQISISHPNPMIAQNIYCPYYAWRSWVATSAHHAGETSIKHSSKEQNARTEELKDWKNLINAATRLKNRADANPIAVGSKSIIEADQSILSAKEDAASRSNSVRILEESLAGFIKAHRSIEKSFSQVKKAKAGNPEIWRTAFYTQMGILWKIMTGASALTENGPFWRLLDTAYEVIFDIEAESYGQNHWGQYNSLKWRLSEGSKFESKDAEYVSSPIACVDDYTSASMRGEEIRHLVHLAEYEEGDAGFGKELHRIARAALELQGYCTGSYTFVVRKIVLLKLSNSNLLNPALLVQLGWINSPNPPSVDGALRKILDQACRGEFTASVVIHLVAQCDAMSQRLVTMMAGEPPPHTPLTTWIDIQREIRHRMQDAPEWHARDEKWKAMIAAGHLLTVGRMAAPGDGGLDALMKDHLWDAPA